MDAAAEKHVQLVWILWLTVLLMGLLWLLMEKKNRASYQGVHQQYVKVLDISRVHSGTFEMP